MSVKRFLSESDEDLSKWLKFSEREVGRGCYGTVFSAQVLDEEVVGAKGEIAVKILPKAKNPTFEKEIGFLTELNNLDPRPSEVVKVFSIFETPSSVYIAHELLKGGDMFDFVCSKNYYFENISIREILILIRKALKAVEICHEQDFSHLDIKPENFMFRQNFDRAEDADVVLIDFGSCQRYANRSYAKRHSSYQEGMDDIFEDNFLPDLRGTASYISPELIQDKRFSSRSDTWSIGVSLFMFLTGQRPFNGESDRRVIQQISINASSNDGTNVFHSSPFLSHVRDFGVLNLLTKLTESDPSLRPSSTEAIERIDKLLQRSES